MEIQNQVAELYQPDTSVPHPENVTPQISHPDRHHGYPLSAGQQQHLVSRVPGLRNQDLPNDESYHTPYEGEPINLGDHILTHSGVRYGPGLASPESVGVARDLRQSLSEELTRQNAASEELKRFQQESIQDYADRKRNRK